MTDPVITIVVPTLGRAHKLAAVARNIAAVTPAGAYRLVFVVDPDDDDSRAALVGLAGEPVTVLLEAGRYPHKINAGAAATSTPWINCAGDDAVWTPGWLEAALKVQTPDVGVIGTRDLTPSSEDGTHSTQPIVRRAYVTDPGAAFGEPGRVMHEGYHHNFCETELCQLAQHRGAYVFAEDSVIEHHHPDWGTAEEDATYQKGARRHWQRDAQLFADRQAAWSKS